MRARTCATAAALALSATVLAGCHTNVGAAATVDGHRISESTVNDYVSRAGQRPDLLGPALAGQSLIAAKSFVVEILIEQRLLAKALAAQGGLPSDASLAQSHDVAVQGAVQGVVQVPGTGRVLDRQATVLLRALGVEDKFLPNYVRTIELDYVLAQRTHARSSADIVNAVRKTHPHVYVNARYGVWDQAAMSLDGSDSAGLPSYLSLQAAPGSGG